MPLDDNEPVDDWADYESGPFCRHWAEAYDCDIKCAACGHPCRRHHDRCYEDDCGCVEWKEPA